MCAVTEAEFQAWVVEVAQRFGWKVWHVPAPMVHAGKRGWVGAKQGAGISDLILISDHPPRMIFAEIKREGGKLSDKQQEFLQAVQAVAEDARESRSDEQVIKAYAWWPGMEEMIETVLRTRVLA